MTLKLTDFQLGRIQFPTAETAFQEAVGDALDSVGAALAAGERKPRPFTFTLPVRASDREANPYTEGNRMRRQVRSLMENAAARMAGLYMKVAFDPELNAWLLIGGGQLEYNTEGAVVFADYKLTLSDSYVAGQLRSHRPAKRIEVFDRRLSTTPRDYERLVYASTFAATPLVAEVAMPHGATDLRARSSASVSTAATVATADGGTVLPVKGIVNGDVLSFEQPEENQNLGDVLVLDRRGVLAPAGLMEAKEPQANYGWEEVYGPNYPLSEGDVPVLSNGLCRIRYLTAPLPCFAWDEFSGGAWVERYRFTPAVGSEGWVTGLTYAAVKEWTPDRATIFARFAGPVGLPPIDCYITLARGWSGPRLEAYIRPGGYGTEYTARFYTAPATNFNSVFSYSGGMRISPESWTTTYSYISADEPWGVVSAVTGGVPRLSFSLTDTHAIVLTTSNKLWGSARNGFAVRGSATGGVLEFQKLATGYVGIDLQTGGENGAAFEAETYRNAESEAKEFTDAEAEGGKAVYDTQALQLFRTIWETSGGTALGLVNGSTYDVWARVKIIPSYKAAVIATAGIVSLWSLNDASGVAADSVDSNPGTNNGTLTRNQASLVPDGEGASTKFNGTTGYFSVASAANNKVGDVFTLEAWIKPEAIGTLMSIISGPGNAAELRVSAAGKLQLVKNEVAVLVESTNTLVANTVYHVVATKTGATVKLYVNGADVTGVVTNQTMSATEGAWNIGRRSSAFNDEFFKGWMQYAALYNTALSKAVVEEHYAARVTATVGSFMAQIGTANGETFTATSEFYVWLNLGPITKPLATSRFAIYAWRSAGTVGRIVIDRVSLAPMNSNTFDGALDLASASLADARVFNELVAR